MSDAFVVEPSNAVPGDPFATPRRLVPIAALGYVFVRMLDAVESGSSSLAIGLATIVAAIAGVGILCGYFSLHPALDDVPLAKWRSTNPAYWESLCMTIAMTIVILAITQMAGQEGGRFWSLMQGAAPTPPR